MNRNAGFGSERGSQIEERSSFVCSSLEIEDSDVNERLGEATQLRDSTSG